MRVCVVGAGASGLPSIKSCLEAGLEVVCYERTSELGGLWNYRPNQNAGGTVMKSTVVNTSKEMMAYSDFPPPADWPNFMHHTKVQQYLSSYADEFDIRKHIRFNTTVKMITEDGAGWRVELEDGTVETFDRLMLCTGHHATPFTPQLNGLSSFTGKVMHAHDYTDTKGFEEKDVFIMGIGNSALDIAVDIAKIAKSVTISTRRGTWIFNRVADGGMPYDTLLMTRYYEKLMNTISWSVANDFMEHKVQRRMDHEAYGLRPNHRFFQQHPTVNDAMSNLLCAGYVKIVDDVECLESDAVRVKGGKRFPCDVFIACTGYTFGYPYMKSEMLQVTDRQVPLYKFVFPASSEKLAVIGLIQPIGSIMPISEMQARWAAAVFAGEKKLPSPVDREADIAFKKKEMTRRYFQSEKHTIQVDYMKYMDELAGLIGCMPNLNQILIRDPRFWWRLWKGPNVPYVYRLEGPGRWTAAEAAIRSVGERVKRPLKNRECRVRRHKRRGMDEWFKYGTSKFLLGEMTKVVFVGLLYCCAGAGVNPFVFFAVTYVFFSVALFYFLWFDIQWDMTTIL